MLAAVLRTLGACAEGNAGNASKVIAARGVMPSFQLLNSRLPTIRREAAFTLACLFQSEASQADTDELTNVEGRLMHYLVDCITSTHERDQAYAAVLLARMLTHVRTRLIRQGLGFARTPPDVPGFGRIGELTPSFGSDQVPRSSPRCSDQVPRF